VFGALQRQRLLLAPHNSQLIHQTQATLIVLELSRSDLPLAHHFNHVAHSLYG
jgi:hypothetical protein